MKEFDPRGVTPPEELTASGKSPYAKGRSTMPEGASEIPKGNPQEKGSEESGEAYNPLTKKSDDIENPLIKEFAKEFENDLNKTPLKDWPTDKLIKEYQKLHGVKSRIAAIIGLGQREKTAIDADSQPYNTLISIELLRRGVDIGELYLQTLQLVEQQGKSSLLKNILPVSGGSGENDNDRPWDPIDEHGEDEPKSDNPEIERALEEYEREHPNLPREALDATKAYSRATGKTPQELEEALQAKSRSELGQMGRLERGEGKIHDLNEFLEEVIENSDPKWGLEGDYPLINIKINKETGEEEGEINQENFLRWIRDRMVFFHNESPNEEFSFYQKVRLQRFYRDISVNDMLENQALYFRDKQGRQYSELADQIRREVWQFSYWRNADIEYKLLMGNDTEAPKVILKRFYQNDATRTLWGKSMLAHTLTMPEKFNSNPIIYKGGNAEKPGSQPELDANVGIGLNNAFLSYYYLSDNEKLKELLGEGSPLLTRSKIIEQIKESANEARVDPKLYIEHELAIKLMDTSQTLTQEELINFINIYNSPEKPARMIEVVRKLITKSIQEKFGLKPEDAIYAEQFAFNMTRLLGAGWRNDTEAYAYDAGAKPGKTKRYRMRQTQDTRGGAFGNPYSIHMLKSLMVDFLAGTRTETFVKDENDKPIKDSEGKLHQYSPLELMELMEKAGTDSDEVHRLAKEMIFPENTMRQYSLNHVDRAFQIFHDITEGTEIDWNKFVITEPTGGVRFSRAAFEKEVKENFFKKMRYMLATYGQLDFSKKIRVQVGKDKWEDQPLALTMFGRELLDIPTFWKRDENDNVIKGQDGHNEIDFDKVQNNKAKLWKQVALGRLAADLYAHRDYHSTDPRYNNYFYMQVIDALELIPANVLGDEDDLQSARQSGRFFKEDDIDWLRKKSSTEQWRLYKNMILSDVFKGSIKGFRDGIKLWFKAIIEQ